MEKDIFMFSELYDKYNMTKHDFSGAYDIYEEIICNMFNLGIYTENIKLYVWIGFYYYTRNPPMYDMMKQYYDKAITEDNNIDAIHLYGIYYQKMQQYIKMTSCYDQAINKGHFGALIRLVDYYDNDSAIKLLHDKQSEDKWKVRAIYLLGKHYEKMHQYDNMLIYYKQAIELDNMDALHNLVNYYYNNNENKMAEKILVDIGKKGKADALYLLAKYYESKDLNTSKKIKYYELAIRQNHLGAMFDLAHEYQRTGKNPQKMIKYYKKCIKNGMVNAMISLASYYEKKGNHDDMIFFYQLAIMKCDIDLMNELDQDSMYDMIEKYYIVAVKNGDATAWLKFAQYYKKIIRFALIKSINIFNEKNIKTTHNKFIDIINYKYYFNQCKKKIMNDLMNI